MSLLGSGLTEFALGVWVYQTTGSITQFALISLCIHLPNIIVSPFAGAIVDRWDRRWAMILSDSVTGVAAIVVLTLVLQNRLEIWHIYVGVAISSVFNAFQWPAYLAAIAQLVPKNNLSRANGMVQIAGAVAKISGPIVAGFLLSAVRLEGVLFIDLCTFVFAIVTLLSVRFPKFEQTSTPSKKVNLDRLWGDIVSGWNYIIQRPGLRTLTMFFAISYFSEGCCKSYFGRSSSRLPLAKPWGWYYPSAVAGCYSVALPSVPGAARSGECMEFWVSFLCKACVCASGEFRPR